MVLEITTQTLEQVLATDKLIVIDFYATWCGPCIAFKPVFHKVAAALSDISVFGQVNIDEWRDLAITYRVSSIPTLIAIKNKKVVWTQTGKTTEASLTEKIKSLS